MKLNFAKRMSYIKASEIREILKVTEQEDVISFAGGLPAPELFPIDEINEINQIVLKEAGTKARQYTTTEGYVPLREWIANRMNERLGTTFDKDNILITHGSQQGLDLSGKVFRQIQKSQTGRRRLFRSKEERTGTVFRRDQSNDSQCTGHKLRRKGLLG